MNENVKKPKVRFKGYEDAWEQRKLSDLGEIMTGSTPSTSKEEYYSVDGIPWVTPTDINTQIISDTPRKLSEEGAKVGRVVPANTILCTCIASIGKNALLTVEGSFNQQINSLTPYTENNAYFLLTESEIWSDKMKKMAASGTMQIVNKTEFSELITMVPKTDEQKKIGDYFRTLDHLITLHQRECEQAKKYKKYMLQKMFPQNGSNVPEIRFSGFTHPWEQRKLGDVCSRVQGNDGRMELPTLTISAGNGWMRQEDRFSGNIAGKEQRNYTLLHRGELSYNHGNSKLAKYGAVFSLQTYEEALVPRVYHSFKVENGDADFVEYYFATKLPDKELGKLISSGARMDGLLNIGYEEFMWIPFLFPNEEEQSKISSYFRTLDYLITLHQQKCEELQKIKKFMLQNMFV